MIDKRLSKRRRRLNSVAGLLLLAGLVTVFWPFVVGRGQMRSFCASLPVGASLAEVQRLTSGRGYRLSAVVDGKAFAYDTGSMARFNCDLRVDDTGLVSARYADNS